MIERPGVMVHPSAEVADSARIGQRTRVWHLAQIREGAVIGQECVVGRGVYIDRQVVVGNRCKLQNNALVYYGFELEDGVFLGPGVMLLNDTRPRAITPAGALKSDSDWLVAQGLVREGAAVGGGAVVLPGITVGRFAMIGAGAIVTRDVPDYGLVYGNPARLHGFVCACGAGLPVDKLVGASCPECGASTPKATS